MNDDAELILLGVIAGIPLGAAALAIVYAAVQWLKVAA